MTVSHAHTRLEEELPGQIGAIDDGLSENPNLKIGRDIRFVLVCVGGGATRIGEEVLKRKLRHLESIVINCDPRVPGLEAFDRRVCLGAGANGVTETGGSASAGSQLARAAEPALDRIFQGATFVTILASLGGGTGTGALPFVVEAASRHAAFVSLFVVKPFRWEAERRALADRAVGRLSFVDAWVEKTEHHLATLATLDNESLVADAASTPMNRWNRHWADTVATHIEKEFLDPVEASFAAARLARLAESEPLNAPAREVTLAPPMPGPGPAPLPPGLPALLTRSEPYGDESPSSRGEVELTFEVIGAGPRGPEFL
jgi:Tubulin/FtsZ family, GTPase domain